MSVREEKIREEVDKTLDAFKEMEKIEANAFLFTRIKAELESPSIEKRTMGSAVKDKLLPALLFILIVLNTVSITYRLRNNTNDSKGRAEYVSAFAKQYSLAPSANDYSINLFKGE